MLALSKGMVLSTSSSLPSISKLNKSTVVWFKAKSMEYSGRHWTFTDVGEDDLSIFARTFVPNVNAESFGLVVKLKQAGTNFTFLCFSNADAKLLGSASIKSPDQPSLRSSRNVLERYSPSKAPHSMKNPLDCKEKADTYIKSL